MMVKSSKIILYNLRMEDKQQMSLIEEISTDDTVWSIIEKEIDLEKLYVAIHRLDIWEKIVLQKIFWEGLSEKRIAEELNISRSTLNYRKGKIYKKM